jgi:hypothetical protein
METQNNPLRNRSLNYLGDDQIAMIDDALASICEGPESFGEVRLVVEKGRLRFIRVERSFDVLRWCAERVGMGKSK